jgi:tetratricopeptide (TPR) repeat protein
VWRLSGGRVLKIAHAGHELARARHAREAEALAAIGAPAVPALHEQGVTDDGRAWLVMDEITGTTFAELTTQGPLGSREAVSLGIATLASLARVHIASFVHRDLKPDNLVRRADGTVVILDLGLARKLPDDPDDPTRANVQVGSLEYIPPEQLVDSARVDVRSDLYAFGCILYELFAGRPPFVGDAAALERAHAALRPPRLHALANVPGAVEALVHECLQKQPERRPASAADVAARLAAATDEPSSVKTARSMSLIREGRQPVVLVWAELPRVDRALLGTLSARRLVVISQRGRRVLAGVLGGDHADPASVAIAAARDLAASGARVALHLEALRVDASGGRSSIHGPAAEAPEGWLPTATWTGVVLTRALASVTQVPTLPSDFGDAFRALAAGDGAHELVGRDVLLTDLAADAAAALGAAAPQGPAFALLVGEPGVGKTAFAAELGRRLAELGMRVHVAALPPPGAGKPGHAALAPLIGGVPAGANLVRTIGDALRAAARAEATALILDDLHLAEHELLDALEYATLGGEPLPLWVLGIASPRLEQRRPQLGERAERHRRDVLPSLDEDASVALLATLLHPAEYPPLRALRRLAALAHGNPLHLAMLAREIHERGAVRERPGGGGHFLDTGALDDLQQLALGPWLAARELSGMSEELVALARVCAALGGEVSRDELVAVVDAVERAGGASTPIDVDVGLRELTRSQLLAPTSRGYVFRQTLVEEGIYSTTHEDERAALHRAALAYWRTQPAGDPAIAERIARHAEAVGDRAAAAAAFMALGERALDEHRLFDVDESFTGALRNLDASDLPRARALLGRARGRYKMQRIRDALADLAEAFEIATGERAVALEVEILLEQATAHDWGDDWKASAELATRAAARLANVPADLREPLELDVALAVGRSAFRNQQFHDAAETLEHVVMRAGELGRYEVETVARLLLAPALVELRRLDDAERVFADLIALCERRQDRAHIGFAYANRAWLWSARGRIERTVDDLRHVIQVARELGQASVERVGSYNLAEDRLWEGDLDDALRLAQRGFALQRAHGEGTTRPDRLLLARILAARDDRAELASILATFESEELGPDEEAIVGVLRACTRDTEPGTWRKLLQGIETLGVAQRLELLHLAAQRGQLAIPRDEVKLLARQDPIWANRADEF